MVGPLVMAVGVRAPPGMSVEEFSSFLSSFDQL